MDSSIDEDVSGAMELEEALRAFAVAVKVDGTGGDGQLAAELGDMGGEGGWGLGLVGLVERARRLRSKLSMRCRRPERRGARCLG